MPCLRRTIHSILSLVARFSRPVQNITTTFACLVACPRYYCCFSFLFFFSFARRPLLGEKRVQSAQMRARVCVHARPRARDNKCFSSMFYACACVCCSSLKSISRPSLYSRVLSLFLLLLLSLQPYTHTLENNFDKKNGEETRVRKRKEAIWCQDPIFLFYSIGTNTSLS